MKKGEKIWLYFVVFYSILHLVRDIQQDLGMHNFLTDVLASDGPPKVPAVIYWTIFNTYLIEAVSLILAVYSLKKNHFGLPAKLTIMIAIASVSLWSIYYFLVK